MTLQISKVQNNPYQSHFAYPNSRNGFNINSETEYKNNVNPQRLSNISFGDPMTFFLPAGFMAMVVAIIRKSSPS